MKQLLTFFAFSSLILFGVIGCSSSTGIAFNQVGCFVDNLSGGGNYYFSQTQNADGTYSYSETDTNAQGVITQYNGIATIAGNQEIDQVTGGAGVGRVTVYNVTTPDANTITYTVVSDSSGATQPGTSYTYTRTTCR